MQSTVNVVNGVVNDISGMNKVEVGDTAPTVDISNGKTERKRLRRALPSLPSTASASEMGSVSYEVKVEATPTNWEALPIYSVFSLSPDGSYPLIKVHRSKYADLRTGNSHAVGSGRCFRVIF
jgi:hypothetical protein